MNINCISLDLSWKLLVIYIGVCHINSGSDFVCPDLFADPSWFAYGF